MNCYKCGEEIKEPAGYICQPCLDEVANEEIGVLAEMADEDEAEKDGNMPLSPREAIIAMLRGATLQNKNGYKFGWSESAKAFINIEAFCVMKDFSGLSYVSTKKTSPMDTFQCRAWVNSSESQGFMVSVKHKDTNYWEDWDIPQRFKYDGKENYYNSGVIFYRRARVLPDKSGIDESTIQGFVIEEEA